MRCRDALFVAVDAPFEHRVGRSAGSGGACADRSPAGHGGRRATAAAPSCNASSTRNWPGSACPRDAYALMGFSQGAMTALFTGLRRAAAPRAILAFSGALIAPGPARGGTGQPRAGAAGARRGGRRGAGAPLARGGGGVACGRSAGGGRSTCRGSGTASTTPAWRWARWPCSGRSLAGEAVSTPSHCALDETVDHWVSGGLGDGMAAIAPREPGRRASAR